MEEYKIARGFRDARIGTIGGGTSEIMREIIAKMVIDEVSYKSANNRKPQNGVLNENGQASTNIEELVENIRAKAAKTKPLGNTLKFDFGNQQLFIDVEQVTRFY